MSFSLGKTRLRLHPLLPLFWFFLLLSGHGDRLLAAISALLLHELGHLAAAKLLAIPVTALEITPFGGVLNPDRYEGVSGVTGFLYAAAGPVMSLAGCLFSALLLRWGVPFAFVQRFARASLLLLLINLLPALPLDGGEMLRSILTIWFSHQAVTKALAYAGYSAGLLLSALSLIAAFRGEIILAPLLAGLYLIYAVSIQQRQSTARYVTALIARRQRLERHEILPLEALSAAADTPARLILPRLSLGKYHLIFVLSRDGMDCLGSVDEKTFCELVMSRPETPIGDCLHKLRKTSGPNG